jgi:hypothetical protein
VVVIARRVCPHFVVWIRSLTKEEIVPFSHQKTQAHWLVAFFLEILLHHAEEVLELEVLKVADRSQ